MSKTYDLSLVYAYIWGKDIVGYEIDELENDPSFMIQVLERTHDKKMYELCSETVKCDYTFVRRVIDLFSSDLDFLLGVAEYYIDSLSEAEKEHGTSFTELSIIMSDLCGRTLNDFTLRAAGFYMAERVRQEACVSVLDGEACVDSAKGFVFTSVQYEDSDIIVDYVARRMVNEALFGERYNNLEYLIHRRFKSFAEFSAYGAVNFLHDCIGAFDAHLRDYTFYEREECFDMFFGRAFKDIERVKCGWSAYMTRVNSWRVDTFHDEMLRFMLDDCVVGSLDYTDIATYVANKLGVVEVFKMFSPEFVEAYDEDRYRTLELNDALCINKGLEIAKRLFEFDVIDDDFEYVDSRGETAMDMVDSTEEKSGIIRFKVIDAVENAARK